MPAILDRERHEVAARRRAGFPARFAEEHQRDESHHGIRLDRHPIDYWWFRAHVDDFRVRRSALDSALDSRHSALGLRRSALGIAAPALSRLRLVALVTLLAGGAIVVARQDVQPPTIDIDHVILGINDLERGVRQFAARTGVTPARGGEHPGRGTQNGLASLGAGRYLEIRGR